MSYCLLTHLYDPNDCYSRMSELEFSSHVHEEVVSKFEDIVKSRKMSVLYDGIEDGIDPNDPYFVTIKYSDGNCEDIWIQEDPFNVKDEFVVEDVYILKTDNCQYKFPVCTDDDRSPSSMEMLITQREYEILKESGKYETEEFNDVILDRDHTFIRQARVCHVVKVDRVTNTNY